MLYNIIRYIYPVWILVYHEDLDIDLVLTLASQLTHLGNLDVIWVVHSQGMFYCKGPRRSYCSYLGDGSRSMGHIADHCCSHSDCHYNDHTGHNTLGNRNFDHFGNVDHDFWHHVCLWDLGSTWDHGRLWDLWSTWDHGRLWDPGSTWDHGCLWDRGDP